MDKGVTWISALHGGITWRGGVREISPDASGALRRNPHTAPHIARHRRHFDGRQINGCQRAAKRLVHVFLVMTVIANSYGKGGRPGAGWSGVRDGARGGGPERSSAYSSGLGDNGGLAGRFLGIPGQGLASQGRLAYVTPPTALRPGVPDRPPFQDMRRSQFKVRCPSSRWPVRVIAVVRGTC